MPIRPEMRSRYPKDWRLRSFFVRFIRAKGICEGCGVRHGDVIRPVKCCAEPIWDDRHICLSCGKPVPRVVLTAAHIHDHNPEAADLLNLAAWCQKCHNRHDRDHRQRGIRDRRERASGQLDLFRVQPI